jgi:hypothetical protein
MAKTSSAAVDGAIADLEFLLEELHANIERLEDHAVAVEDTISELCEIEATEYPWRLEVVHDGRYTDEEIKKVVGRWSDASGSGFGQRDQSWYFKTEAQAKAVSAKLGRKFRKLDSKTITDIREQEVAWLGWEELYDYR